MRHSSVDHDRTAARYRAESVRDVAQTPGFVVVCAATLALAVCVANFALGQARAGVVAAIVAMLAFGAGLAWLAMDGRRVRQAQRDWVIGHPGR
ncbi:LapA family protein [Mycobacterium sp.]|jgi:hypothetical protein|uniref:LapA family protein n=1 Tax=Mycobacterium sp. TaxID=1785 RepID=UPI0026058D82|nr:LapA family protein [Mycobacterium sp.]